MAVNLIDLASTYLTPDVVSKLAGVIGEKPTGTQKAIESVVPALLGGAIGQASTPSGLSSLMSLIGSEQTGSEHPGQLERSTWRRQLDVKPAIKRRRDCEGSLRRQGRTRSGPAGKQVTSGNLSASELARLLMSQKTRFPDCCLRAWERHLDWLASKGQFGAACCDRPSIETELVALAFGFGGSAAGFPGLSQSLGPPYQGQTGGKSLPAA